MSKHENVHWKKASACVQPFLLTPFAMLGFLFTSLYPNVPKRASPESEQRQVSQTGEAVVIEKQVLNSFIVKSAAIFRIGCFFC